jgi:hypothetical protein
LMASMTTKSLPRPCIFENSSFMGVHITGITRRGAEKQKITHSKDAKSAQHRRLAAFHACRYT